MCVSLLGVVGWFGFEYLTQPISCQDELHNFLYDNNMFHYLIETA